MNPRLFLSIVLLIAGLAQTCRAVEWTYSVPVGQDPERRAYLWVPPDCTHVRGVLIGIQNMQEQLMFDDPTIRKVVSDCGLAIVWITPGDDVGDKTSLLHKFNPPDQALAQVQKALADLAKESGYPEIENAPLIAIGHSAATPFVWGMGNVMTKRMIAIIPYKGWFGGLPPNLPALHVSSEYGEVGGVNWGETYMKDRDAVMHIRSAGNDREIGEFSTIGSGHYGWDPVAAPIIATFIRKAVQYRLPAESAGSGPVDLTPVDPASGWLVDPATLGTTNCKPVSVSQYSGDPKFALWYFDEEMAKSANDFMAAGLAKKPQIIDWIINGQPDPLIKGGNPDFHPTFLDDGVTFKVAATYLDKSPIQNLYGGAAVGHSSAPITFMVNTGALKQTGPDTFRVWMWGPGGTIRQSAPWEPQIMGCSLGDNEYRRADRPCHPWVYVVHKEKDATPQAITMSKIADQVVGVKSVPLSATSTSGLPVQFFVVSGPVELSDDNQTLQFLPISPHAHYPLRVIVGGYQWGRITGAKIQSADPAYEEFFIKKSASDPTGVSDLPDTSTQTNQTTQPAAPAQ